MNFRLVNPKTNENFSMKQLAFYRLPRVSVGLLKRQITFFFHRLFIMFIIGYRKSLKKEQPSWDSLYRFANDTTISSIQEKVSMFPNYEVSTMASYTYFSGLFQLLDVFIVPKELTSACDTGIVKHFYRYDQILQPLSRYLTEHVATTGIKAGKKKIFFLNFTPSIYFDEAYRSCTCNFVSIKGPLRFGRDYGGTYRLDYSCPVFGEMVDNLKRIGKVYKDKGESTLVFHHKMVSYFSTNWLNDLTTEDQHYQNHQITFEFSEKGGKTNYHNPSFTGTCKLAECHDLHRTLRYFGRESVESTVLYRHLVFLVKCYNYVSIEHLLNIGTPRPNGKSTNFNSMHYAQSFPDFGLKVQANCRTQTLMEKISCTSTTDCANRMAKLSLWQVIDFQNNAQSEYEETSMPVTTPTLYQLAPLIIKNLLFRHKNQLSLQHDTVEDRRQHLILLQDNKIISKKIMKLRMKIRYGDPGPENN